MPPTLRNCEAARTRRTELERLREGPLPNAGSKYQTVSTILIDRHYAKIDLHLRWDWKRFATLAQRLRLTPAELASTVLMPHQGLERFMLTDQMPKNPKSWGRPVSLILTMLEATYMKGIASDLITNPFPKFGDPTPDGPS